MLDKIKQIIKGEVSSDERELSDYSHDASIFEVKPELIVKPKDVDDIKKIVKFVSDHKSSNPNLSLTVRAGGSDMSGGPLNESIILDFTAHMNRVIEVDESRDKIAGGYVIVEPGSFYRNFEKETLKKNLLLPSYPASRELCTVGGMVANNAGGEKSLFYGKTDKYVEELDVVLSDGNEYIFKSLTDEELERKKIQNDFEGDVYRKMHKLLITNYELLHKAKPNVSKNSAGYALWDVWDKERFDLTKLYVGSQGTLGLITKVKFKLVKPSKCSKLVVIFLKDLESLGEIVNFLNQFKPESVESFDDNTFKIVSKILPVLIKRLGLGILLKFIPDLWNIVVNGIPKITIIVGFAGDNERELDSISEKCKEKVSAKFKVKTRIAKSKKDAEKYWVIRRESFNLLRNKIGSRKTTPFIDDFIVRPEYLPEFLPKLNEILNQYKNYMIYTIAGHPGDGNFHVIPLMDLSNEKSRQIILEISEQVYNLILQYNGSITAEHNDGLIRTPYLEKMYGTEVYNLFKEVKNIFDPQNIFNPRKKVGADLDYLISHIRPY